MIGYVKFTVEYDLSAKPRGHMMICFIFSIPLRTENRSSECVVVFMFIATSNWMNEKETITSDELDLIMKNEPLPPNQEEKKVDFLIEDDSKDSETDTDMENPDEKK